MPWQIRGVLVLLAFGLVGIFGIAWWLNPYQDDGQAKVMETHLQLGLPPCTFRVMTGVPCPACGMTTSFALLAHGDLWNSLRANAVGTLLAAFLLLLLPWTCLCAAKGRSYGVASLERAVLVVVSALLILLLLRWCWVVGPVAWNKYMG